MTGTTACWVGGSWFEACGGGIDVGEGEDEVASDDNDTKPSEAVVDGATGEGGGIGGVVVALVPVGTKACRKFVVLRRGITGGNRYNLHQLILPDASILPAPSVGVRGALCSLGFEACLAEWTSKKVK